MKTRSTGRRITSWQAAGCAIALTAGLLANAESADATVPTTPSLQNDFTAAAHESGVPVAVLDALAYQESAWDGHGGAPSASGGYGVMQLTDVTAANLDGLDPSSPKARAIAGDSTLSTAHTAAKLIGASTAAVETNDQQNIRAGAALLASYGRATNHGSLPSTASGWYAAVAKYSGAADAATAQTFADGVFAKLRTGLTAQGMSLAPQPSVASSPSSLAVLGLPSGAKRTAATKDGTQLPECPVELNCDYVPAALALNNPSDLSSYGNYDPANRPAQSPIRYITLHDTEETYAGAVATFQNPAVYASANYVVRSSDGHVTQMVPDEDIAWDSGNWSIYQHSVSIENEGWALHGATWYTEAEYESDAQLVRYLAAKYDVPLDRQHIFGHDDIPGSNDHNQATQHWDPGPNWDWSHFMDLLGAPILPFGLSAASSASTASPSFDPQGGVVTVKPDFQGNLQVVSGCPAPGDPATGPCGEQPAQPVNFVWLRTAPSDSAPLMSDPYLHPDGSAGTDEAYDWGDKATTGQKFVVADRQITANGVWTAIWYGGKEAWFDSPWTNFAAWPSSGLVVTPKPGAASIPVYATAAPEAAAYPPPIAAVDMRTPKLLTQYSIPAGQSYVASGPPVNGEFWYARNIDGSAPDDRTEVVGTTMFYLISYNHRMAWVNAADVVVAQH